MSLCSVQLLKDKGIEQGIITIFPVKLHTPHINKYRRKSSWFLIVGGTVYLLIKLVFNGVKKNRLKIKRRYQVLFYVPNNKYKRFVDALTENVSFSYLIIGEEIYDPSVVSVDDYKLLHFKNYPLRLFRELYNLFLHSLKTNQLSDFRKNYWNILSLVRRDLTVNALFKQTAFDKYFSFHPVEGFHQVIQNFYKDNFKETFAIRPTTTSMSKEHQFISTDNMFYKTDNELQIYQRSNLKSLNLIKGGLIANPKPITENNNKKGILFLDTCTNVNPASIAIRREVISQFLNLISKFNEDVYYRFHPGLIESEEKLTKREIGSFANPKIKIINADIPWDKIKVAFGFDTTLYYDCFLYEIPVISFRGEYYLFPNKTNEFTNSPVIPINNESDFKAITKLLDDQSFWKHKKDEQFLWFSKQYNFPEGMEAIKGILAK